jgi:methyl-accepting chemotaxis protein
MGAEINIKSIKTKVIVATFLLLTITIGGPVFANPEEADAALARKASEITLRNAEAVAEGVAKEMAAIKAVVEFIAMDDKIKAADPIAVASRMAEIKNSQPTIETLFLAAQDGNFVDSDGNSGSVADRDCFKEAVQKQVTVIADGPVVSESTGKLVVVVATPVKENNLIRGFIVAAVNIDAVEKFIAKQKFGKTGYAYLIGKSGLIFIHPNKQVAMKRNIVTIPVKALADMWQAVLAGNKVIEQYVFGGEEKLIVCVPVPGTSWVICGSANKAEVMAEINAREILSR